MKSVITFSFVILSSALWGQTLGEAKSLYSAKQYEECFELLDELRFDKKSKKDPELYVYRALCYYHFSTDAINKEAFPSPMKNALKSLIKAKSLDNSGDTFEKHQKPIAFLQRVFNRKIEALEKEGKAVQANYFIKNMPRVWNQQQKNEETLPEKETVTEEQTLIAQAADSLPQQVEPPLEKQEESPTTSTHNTHTPLLDYAFSLQGIPYRYGGTTKKGFDCSGYTGHVYQKTGVQLPRTSKEQAKVGEKVSLKKAQAGDLIFFGKGGKVNHVGILTNEKGDPLTMVHCSNSKGVAQVNIEQDSYWSKRVLFARRVKQ